MLDEQLEFEIAQLADGTLDAGRADAVRALIASDDQARCLLSSYEKMNGAFRTLPTLPAIDWSRFAAHVAGRMSDVENEKAPESYPMPWLKRVAGFAVAACLLIAAGVALRMHTSVTKSPTVDIVRGEIAIAGPAIELPAGQVIREIAIGPSAVAAADNLQYGDAEVVAQASRVVIASAVDAAQDSQQDSSSTPY